jgi:hypothetical protein
MSTVNYEVKGTLAKLLAMEDLIIENRNVSTASFDVDRRVLTLPLWDRASSIVYDLLVGHEVGHALFTPNENWKLKYPELPQNFVNILEDARVEKLIKRRFAGLNKTFYHGYSKLADDDFFGIDDVDFDDLTLADRINLHFKIGNFEDIPFSEKEQYFVDAAKELETFEQVLELTRELYDHCKDSMESPNDQPPQMASSKPDQNQDSGDGEGESQKIQQETSPDTPRSENDFESGEGNPQQKSDADWDDAEEQVQNNPYGGETSELDTITDKNFADCVEDLNAPSQRNVDNAYVEIPQLNLNTIVAKNSDVHDEIETFHASYEASAFEYVDNEFAKFKRSAQKEVNYLVKEFECKKAADAYARATVSRTGVLNTSVLHTYRYNEDLFKKVTVVPDGKNHGLVFVLDWSGSMGEVLLDTVKQLYNLIWFCKKCNIPFDVYAFTNEWATVTYDHENLNSYGSPTAVYPAEHQERIHNELYVERNFTLMNFFTNKVRGKVLEKQLKNLWRVAWGMTTQNRWNVQFQYPQRLSLSGTPLNEALICMNEIIPDFKKRNGVQKVQCIVLTDGEAPPMKYNVILPSSRNPEETWTGTRSCYPNNVFLRDRKTGCQFRVEDGYHGCTDTMLKQLSARFPETNFVGIRVLAPRDSSSFIRRYTESYTEVEKLIKDWKKTKTVSIHGSGYDTYFGLSSTALAQDSEFMVKEDATKGQIKQAFVKSLRTKKMNKKILSEFITLIA